jgi:hypothetical protein
MSGKLKVGVGIAKAGYGAVRDVVKKILKPKPSPVISSVKISKNLKKKRDIQDSVVKTKDKIMESLDAEGKRSVRTTVPLKETNKNISKIYD